MYSETEVVLTVGVCWCVYNALTVCVCFHRWLRQQFDSADVNGDGTLSLKEISKMFHGLNVNPDHKSVKKRFKVNEATDTGGIPYVNPMPLHATVLDVLD